MKKMIALVFFFSLFFGVEATAQQPGDSKPLAGHNSIKARRELWKEKRVHKRDVKNKNFHKVIRTKESVVGERKLVHHKKKRKNKEKTGTATAIVKSDK